MNIVIYFLSHTLNSSFCRYYILQFLKKINASFSTVSSDFGASCVAEDLPVGASETLECNKKLQGCADKVHHACINNSCYRPPKLFSSTDLHEWYTSIASCKYLPFRNTYLVACLRGCFMMCWIMPLAFIWFSFPVTGYRNDSSLIKCLCYCIMPNL